MATNFFLHVGGAGEGFDSGMLAHETTHAVVARLYPGRIWPHWLNEGFAEYMKGASQAARKKVWAKGMQKELEDSTIPLEKLVAMTEYPTEKKEVQSYYQSSEKIVRFFDEPIPERVFSGFH